jgi:hypothetical protein
MLATRNDAQKEKPMVGGVFAGVAAFKNMLEQLARFEKWETEEQRYQLKDFGGNTFAYELKPEAAQGEPPHIICPNCYQKRQKSILQGRGKDALQRDMYHCPSCENEFNLGTRVPPPRQRGTYSNR